MKDITQKIKVLIVDDSKTMREWISNILENDPEIKIVGMASDPYVARDLIKKLNPDVITLDIIMPKMDGITFLKNLMRLHPLPVIMVSSLTEKGSVVALEALSLGAIDYFPKPTIQELENPDLYARNLITSIKNTKLINRNKPIKKHFGEKAIEHVMYYSQFLKNSVIVMGGSTGGIEAIESILSVLPKTFPPILIVQHIRQEFVSGFAKRLNKIYRLNVVEAVNNQEIVPGSVYIAPGGHHLCLKQTPKGYACSLEDTLPVHGLRPAIDVLFSSAADIFGSNTIGILLTGMGEDGAQGAKAIHNAGGTTIVQDKETSVVWGMPGTAVKLNAASYIVPLQDIPEKIFRILDEMSRKSK